MKLKEAALQNTAAWEKAGFDLPHFDRKKVCAQTRKAPKWIHFGAGNIFRAFPANIQQQILNAGKADTGIIVAEGFDYEIIDRMYRPHDNLSVLVTLQADGSIEKTVVGSITESLKVDSADAAEWNRLKEIFCSPSLQMVSFTITEKGYSLVNGKGSFTDAVLQDFQKGPAAPVSYIGKLAALVYARYQNGRLPLALVSMDNCSHNGSKLYSAVSTFSKTWSEAGLTDAGFDAYVNDRMKVSFPWSMIDKITPRPDDSVKEILVKDGFEDVEAEITAKHTYVAPFVNAEETQYLVVEDWFPNGRPNLDAGGVIFTDRETVDKVEKMKVCTCLNPLHTALAIYGCLLGYTLISKEMQDPELKKLVETIGYKEGLPVVVNPGILDPKEFLDTVLRVRIPNPFMPDTPQRIATDTSQKLGIRFGETIKAYLASPTLQVTDLKLIPLVLAGWCRYLLGVDDNGQAFTPSADPLLAENQAHLAGVKLGSKGPFHAALQPILSNVSIFGVDLYEAGLGAQTEAYFAELTTGTGAVRSTLQKYVNA
ncbi:MULTISPECIES: mannitol dehydrogenase family protein [Caproicibacterium]|uniref:Mannitol dehydrogenase family protein n=1 Tax=Caproicibacterium argilliputei TaxID=3030016 RepID=A0AA97DA36_9FIRM|nr:mannitol dehydrogenase family protein [Caproicibacterium argilliputei]WOC31611.1 mannitol dehydrogenase family protein [Caproicibacterium argilliputei]